MRNLQLPLDEKTVRSLKIGEPVRLNGVMLTGRDAAHKWLVDTFIRPVAPPTPADQETIQAIQPLLRDGVIYHCGPVVTGLDTKQYAFVAAGPTTSIREEPYQHQVMQHFGVRGVIGKGGMGAKTLAACQVLGGAYFHAIGGAASLIAQTVIAVLGVYKLEFGVPEAIWVIKVQDFPAVVTMNARGESLHAAVEQNSRTILEQLMLK